MATKNKNGLLMSFRIVVGVFAIFAAIATVVLAFIGVLTFAGYKLTIAKTNPWVSIEQNCPEEKQEKLQKVLDAYMYACDKCKKETNKKKKKPYCEICYKGGGKFSLNASCL